MMNTGLAVIMVIADTISLICVESISLLTPAPLPYHVIKSMFKAWFFKDKSLNPPEKLCQKQLFIIVVGTGMVSNAI